MCLDVKIRLSNKFWARHLVDTVANVVEVQQHTTFPGWIVGKPETVGGVQPKNCLKTNLTPAPPSHRTNLMLPSLDLQSWILVVPLVSDVSECSTIRTAFALPRRDDNGAETSTRLAKKGKAR
jgi:hypothetical protein